MGQFYKAGNLPIIDASQQDMAPMLDRAVTKYNQNYDDLMASLNETVDVPDSALTDNPALQKMYTEYQQTLTNTAETLSTGGQFSSEARQSAAKLRLMTNKFNGLKTVFQNNKKAEDAVIDNITNGNIVPQEDIANPNRIKYFVEGGIGTDANGNTIVQSLTPKHKINGEDAFKNFYERFKTLVPNIKSFTDGKIGDLIKMVQEKEVSPERLAKVLGLNYDAKTKEYQDENGNPVDVDNVAGLLDSFSKLKQDYETYRQIDENIANDIGNSPGYKDKYLNYLMSSLEATKALPFNQKSIKGQCSTCGSRGGGRGGASHSSKSIRTPSVAVNKKIASNQSLSTTNTTSKVVETNAGRVSKQKIIKATQNVPASVRAANNLIKAAEKKVYDKNGNINPQAVYMMTGDKNKHFVKVVNAVASMSNVIGSNTKIAGLGAGHELDATIESFNIYNKFNETDGKENPDAIPLTITYTENGVTTTKPIFGVGEHFSELQVPLDYATETTINSINEKLAKDPNNILLKNQLTVLQNIKGNEEAENIYWRNVSLIRNENQIVASSLTGFSNVPPQVKLFTTRATATAASESNQIGHQKVTLSYKTAEEKDSPNSKQITKNDTVSIAKAINSSLNNKKNQNVTITANGGTAYAFTLSFNQEGKIDPKELAGQLESAGYESVDPSNISIVPIAPKDNVIEFSTENYSDVDYGNNNAKGHNGKFSSNVFKVIIKKKGNGYGNNLTTTKTLTIAVDLSSTETKEIFNSNNIIRNKIDQAFTHLNDEDIASKTTSFSNSYKEKVIKLNRMLMNLNNSNVDPNNVKKDFEKEFGYAIPSKWITMTPDERNQLINGFKASINNIEMTTIAQK